MKSLQVNMKKNTVKLIFTTKNSFDFVTRDFADLIEISKHLIT
jgi:hypothetical protein